MLGLVWYFLEVPSVGLSGVVRCVGFCYLLFFGVGCGELGCFGLCDAVLCRVVGCCSFGASHKRCVV